jgi:hypothetical protein
MKKLPPNATTYTAAFLIAVGLFMIYLAWNGAAGPDAAFDLRAQFPYLLSGGLFGVSLVGAGLVLVRVFEGHRDTGDIVRSIERLTVVVERLEQRMALAEAVDEQPHIQPVTIVPPAAVPQAHTGVEAVPFEQVR